VTFETNGNCSIRFDSKWKKHYSHSTSTSWRTCLLSSISESIAAVPNLPSSYHCASSLNCLLNISGSGNGSSDLSRYERCCTVWVKKSPPPDFSWHFFLKRLGIFGPNFAHLLDVPSYVRLQNFIQLPPALTKLRHIKRDHHYVLKMSTIDRNAHWVVALDMV